MTHEVSNQVPPLTDPALYAQANGGDNAGSALTDSDAKKPGAAAMGRLEGILVSHCTSTTSIRRLAGCSTGE